MRVVAYIRVSTDKQAVEGLGLDVQREQIRRWAKASGHRVVAWEADEGVSGAKGFTEREGLAAALQGICEGGAAGLVVAKLDRLARSLTVQEAALAHVWKCGGAVFSVDQGEIFRDDPDDPMRTAMRQMVGVFGELERAMIGKRLRDGRKHKASNGGFAYGSPPLGFRAEGKELVKDPAEQVTVRRIFALHDEGKSLREIVVTLTEEGHKPKRSSRWHPQTIAKILQRESPDQTLGDGVPSKGGLA